MSIDKTPNHLKLVSYKDVEDEELSFLHDEGLELLAAYRRMEDVSVRLAILELLKSLGSIDPDHHHQTGLPRDF